jgi:pyruvate/2-oxoglutarate dehydrogenase complex dihydrolipoamide dehydrogenase (E3) component
VQRGGEIIDREAARVGQRTRAALEAEGVAVHTGHAALRACPLANGAVVTLDDDTDIPTDVIVLGAGRRPRSADIGVEAAGGRLDGRGAVVIDNQCRAGNRVWALGDLTGVASFTHVVKYQARRVCRPGHGV